MAFILFVIPHAVVHILYLSLTHNLNSLRKHNIFYPATVKLVLSNLPESSKLIIEDPHEKENVRKLLISLKREADTLKRHFDMLSSSNEISKEAHAEMAALQFCTDGIASTLKRGWV